MKWWTFFSEFLVVSRLFSHDKWRDIKKDLEDRFEGTVLINPFMVDKALKMDVGAFLKDQESN